MNFVHTWAFTVCMACVGTGILQQIAPPKIKFSVIKLVLSLYILIAAFAPLSKTEPFQLEMQEALTAQAKAPEVTQAVLLKAQDDIATQIMVECQSRGLYPAQIAVKLFEENGEVAVKGVTVYENGEEMAVQTVITEMLGNVNVVFAEGNS